MTEMEWRTAMDKRMRRLEIAMIIIVVSSAPDLLTILGMCL